LTDFIWQKLTFVAKESFFKANNSQVLQTYILYLMITDEFFKFCFVSDRRRQALEAFYG